MRSNEPRIYRYETLQNAIREELLNRNINKGVATIITQVEVDERDKAFENPTKPIGAFMTKKEADSIVKEGKKVIEDSGGDIEEL